MAKTVKQALAALPEYIRVGALDVTILRSIPVGDNTNSWGLWDSNREVIWMNPETASAQRVVEVFTHELLHAIFHIAMIAETDDEERTVTTLARALADVYRDNPWYGRWLSTYSA